MSEARKAGATLESIKVIPFSGTDTTKGGMEPREFFMKAEVFAATKGFKRALLEDRVLPSWSGKEDLTDEEGELIRQDDEAKHFLIMSCRGDAFAIIESHATAFDMYQALKDRYDSKKTKDLVKATTRLEKCYMKSDLDDPHLWIMEMERLNREVEKCENGTRRSDEQMEATILARLPKRRYESVITSLNGKIGSKDFTHKDFISEILGHYEMFVEPFKNRQARENQDGREKEKGKHLALNTMGGKGGWRAFKGKCNKCGKQGHRARECRMNNNDNNRGERENAKLKVKCYNCGGFGHIAKECPKKGESGMFVGMTIQGVGSREDEVKTHVESTKDHYVELLQDIAEYNNTKTAELKDIRESKWKPRGDEQAGVKVQGEKKKPKTMSWADMCETSDEEDDEDKVYEKTEDVAEDDLKYEESKAQEPEAEEEVIDHERDETHYEESKTAESEAEKSVEYTERTNEEKEESENRMDKSSRSADWMWDEQVFATNLGKFTSRVTECGHESWLVDSGATTHVSINTKMMNNLKTATEGEHVRVGNNETMKATAIGDLTLEQKNTRKKLKLEDVMVVPGFAKNLISVGRLTEKGNEFVAGKDGSKIFNESRGMLEFETGSDGMAYLIASRIKEERKAFSTEGIVEKDEEMEKKERKQYMDINEAHQKFGHATERVVRETLKTLEIIPTGKMSVCDGCARAKATQKRTNKTTKVTADNAGERLYMDTSGPYSETVMGSRYWFKFVDDKTRKSWDFYGARKNGISRCLKDLLDKLKASGKPVKFLRCDNAGEHMSELRKICEGEYGIQLEYTAPHTPQHNGVVERMFSRDAKRALAMMISAAWTKEMQAKLWAEATKTAALLGNVLPNTRSTVPPDEQFYGEKSNIYPHLIQFGRVGYVTNRATMKGKFKEKSSPMVMIGYGENHARDVYRMYNPVTSKVVETRDVHVWADITNAANDIRLTLSQIFDPELILEENEVPDEPAEELTTEELHLIPEYEEELAAVKRSLSPPLSEAGRITADRIFDDDERSRIDREIDKQSDDDRDDKIGNTDQSAAIEDESDSDDSRSVQTDESDEDEEDEDLPVLPQRENAPEMMENRENEQIDEIEQTERPQRSATRLENEMKRLGIDEPIRIEDDEVGMRTRSRTDQVAFNATLSSDPGEPKTFRKAMDGKDGHKWKPSAIVEINNFLSRDAWRKFPRENLKGRKPIPVKWIFKIKEEQDGSMRFKSRIVLKGYVMIPGVDYTEFFSPVATDTTVRTTIAVAVYRQGEGWIMEMIDIEAAFLNAELEPDRLIFAEWPDGMVELGFITEEERKKFCINLTRPMYGGVDVPRLFMKTLFRYLTQVMKMIQSMVDPCLYYWKNEAGEVMLMAVVHVDDVLLAGKKETIEKFKSELKKRFNISDLGRLKKHLGVWYDWKTDDIGETYIVASMTKLEDEIVESFETSVGKSVKEAVTPGYPNKFLSKNQGEPVRMTEYRSIVGKIMYLMTKLAPDLANPARELAQHLSNPGDEHWKALERLVGHIKAKVL